MPTYLAPQTLTQITLNELTIKNEYLTKQNQQLIDNESTLIHDKLMAEEVLLQQMAKFVTHDDNLSEEQTKRQSLTNELQTLTNRNNELAQELSIYQTSLDLTPSIK